MRIFVTGSESFIGKQFLSLSRERGLSAFGVDLCAARTPISATVDIRSPLVANLIPDGTDALVHLAAVSRDVECRSNPRLAYEVNLMGTVNLIEAAKARGVKQFIFASSEWVYGDVLNEQIQTEDQPIDVTRLRSEYAFSKIAGEQILRFAHSQGGPSVTVFRFGIVYGPRMQNWSAVESLLHSVYAGHGIVRVGSVATARRFVHVGDIARGIFSALGRTGFEVINLSGNDLITLGRVIDEGVRLTGRSVRVEETSPSSVSIRNPDNSRAKNLLGWEPRIDFSRGARELMELFQRKEAA